MQYKYFLLTYFSCVLFYVAWRYGLPKFIIEKDEIILFGGIAIFLAFACNNNLQCNFMPSLFLVGIILGLFRYNYFHKVLHKLSPVEFLIMFATFVTISNIIQ